MIRPAISNSNAITPIPMPNTTLIQVLRLRFSFFALMLSIIKRIIEVHSSIHVINYSLSSLSSELVSLLYLQPYVSIHSLLCQDLIIIHIKTAGINSGRHSNIQAVNHISRTYLVTLSLIYVTTSSSERSPEKYGANSSIMNPVITLSS